MKSAFRSFSGVLVIGVVLLVAFVGTGGFLLWDASQVSSVVWDRIQEVFEPLIGFTGAAVGFLFGDHSSRSTIDRQTKIIDDLRIKLADQRGLSQAS